MESLLIVAAIFTALVAVYLLPAIIAYARHTHNSGGILLLNLLLGWTCLGWLVALVMACGSRGTAGRVQITA